MAHAISTLEEAISEGKARREVLQAELDEINANIKPYEKALAALTGEKPPKRIRNRSQASSERTNPTRVGEERLETIKAAILKVATDQDEFRQVDVRAHTEFSSAVMSAAFEQLRQERFVRFARKEGGNKFFRLTPETVKALA
jgi:hypothetical protein